MTAERGSASASQFRLFWLGQTLSCLGDAFTNVALPLLVFQSTGSLAKMTTVTACFGTGSVIAGLSMGRVIDRVDTRRALLACDVGRALLMTSVPSMAWHAGHVPLWFLYALAFVLAFLDTTFNLAYVSFIPQLVPKARIMEANARLNTTAGIAQVLGPALAGAVVQRWGIAVAIGLDAITFLVSVGTLLPLRVGQSHLPRATKHARFEGVRFIIGSPTLRTLVFVLMVEGFLTAGFFDMFVFHLKGTLQQSDDGVGLVFAIASLGAVAASFVAPVAKRRVGMRMTYVLTQILVGLVLLLVPLAKSAMMIAALASGFIFSGSLRAVLSSTYRQEITPGSVLGRTTAVFWLCIKASRPVGALFVGVLVSRSGGVFTFRTLAALFLMLAIATSFATSLGGAAQKASPSER